MAFTLVNFLTLLGVFTVVVVTIFLFEFHRIRNNLDKREHEMSQRMYELSILRELGERIGYSLKIEKIVEIIAGSLRRLLDYSTVSYMIMTTTPEGKERISFSVNVEEQVSKHYIQEIKDKMLNALKTMLNRDFDEYQIDETISGTITDPASSTPVGSYFNVPIIIAGTPVGIMNIASQTPKKFGEQETQILYTIMNQASEAVSKLQHVLEVEKGKLNAMVASMADGVLMIDKQKQLVVINPAARAMLGLSKDQAVNIFDVLDAVAYQFDLRTKLEESISKNQVIVLPPIVISKRYLQVLISPVKDRDKSFIGAVVLFHDVTKEKQVEQMREDFTNMMVHELRSPLTGIRSIAGLLTSDSVKNDQKKYTEFVQLISGNSEDMLSLVNDLLDVAKIESGKFQILKKSSSIRQVAEARVASFAALAQQNDLTLTSSLAQDLPESMEFDEHKIAQVLNNFISNAIKFTGAGGKIMVSAFPLPANRDVSEAVVERKFTWPGLSKGTSFSDQRVVVAVTDTGTGIPADHLDKLFNKFVQLENAAKSEKKGSGLGLVISKGIVESHGASIGVFSEPGEGSTFYFAIPIVSSQIKSN